MKFLLKPAIAGITAAVFAASTIAQDAADYAEIRRDVEVMTRALEAAAGSRGHQRAAISRIEGSYLASQGVVFRLYAHGLGPHSVHPMMHGMDFESFGENIGAYVEDIVSEVGVSLEGLGASLAGMGSGNYSGHHAAFDDFDIDIEPEDWVSPTMAGDPERAEQMRELRRERSAARRDYAMAQREYERRIEEYEEQLETGDDERRAQELYERAESAMVEARDRYRQGRQAYAEKVELLRQEQRAERQRQIATLADDTVDNFCRYGTSLRSLPTDERITLIFEGMGGKGSGDEDLIYVVKKKDLSACMAGDIESVQLMELAETYTF